MLDSFKEALNRNINMKRRNMYQYNKDEIIVDESLKLEKKLEKASYIRPETRERFKASLEKPQELNLTNEQHAKLDSLY